MLRFNNVSEEEWIHNRLSATALIKSCGYKIGTLAVCYSGGVRFMTWPRYWWSFVTFFSPGRRILE